MDGFIGLAVILPLLFFAGWVLKKAAMLYLGRTWPKGWVGLFWISVVAGLGLGVWFSGYAEWDAMRFRRLRPGHPVFPSHVWVQHVSGPPSNRACQQYHRGKGYA